MIICTLRCLLQTRHKEKSLGRVAVIRLYVSTGDVVDTGWVGLGYDGADGTD